MVSRKEVPKLSSASSVDLVDIKRFNLCEVKGFCFIEYGNALPLRFLPNNTKLESLI